MTIHDLLASAHQVAPVGMVVSVCLLQVLGHLQRARECWTADREHRLARRRLERSTAAWQKLRTRELESGRWTNPEPERVAS